MLRKLRMGQIKSAIGLILFCAVLGIFMLCNTGASCITALMGAKPLPAEAEFSDLVGQYVSIEVQYPVDEYMETTKTTKVNGVSTVTKTDRSSWLALDEDQEICFSVEIPYKRYDEMVDQANAFYDALEQDKELPTTGVKVSGTLEILDGEDLGYYNSLARQMDLDSDETVYHISDGMIHGEKLSNVYGITGLGSIFVLFTLFILVKTLQDSPKKLINAYLAANPSVTMEHLESDFASANRQGNVYIGRKWTFSPKLDKLILDNSQVIWVHTSSRRYKQNITYFVLWEMLDGSTLQADQSSENQCTEIMQSYNQFSHIVTGNSPEYAYLLKNDKESFLNLKYQTL